MGIVQPVFTFWIYLLSVPYLNVLGIERDHHKSPCIKANCDQLCVETSDGGTLCACYKGYDLVNKTACEDVDECLTETPICDHHCVNVVGSFECYCDRGYVLEEKSRCRAEGDNALLIFTTGNDIKSLELSDQPNFLTDLHKGLQVAVSVAVDSITNQIFWGDVGKHSIESSSLKGEWKTIVLQDDVLKPECLAIDWIGRHIYFTDVGRNMLMVCSIDGRMCSSLLSSHMNITLHKPRSIVLHPYEGILFWSDWGLIPRILKCGMDGYDCHTIAETDMVWPNDLAIDFPTKKLYFVDAKTDKIEVMNFDGSERKVIFEGLEMHPFGLAVFERTLYWSDWHHSAVVSVNKFTGKDLKTLYVNTHNKPMGLQVYHPVLQKSAPSPCWNSPCSHLCLLNAQKRHTCACPTGMFLSIDRQTCRDDREVPVIFIAAQTSIIKVIPSMAQSFYPEKILSEGIEKVVSLDVDAASGKMFYSDVKSDVIIATQSNNTYAGKTIVYRELITVEKVAVDWIAQNLYWADIGMDRIEVSRFDGSVRTVLKDQVGNLRTIAVDPVLRQIFYSKSKEPSEIVGCDLAMENCDTLISNVGWAAGLWVDREGGQIYWSDMRNGLLESVSLTGEHRRTVIRGIWPYSILILNDLIYWTQMDSPSIHFANKINGSDSGRILEGVDTLMTISLMDLNHQLQVENGCSTNNGNCSHLCLALLDGSRFCKCGNNQTLQDDKQTCIDVSGCTKDMFTCSPTNCIAKSKVCDGIKDCPDGKDENNCEEETCSSTFKQCNNGVCIPLSWWCDGDTDCLDGSDEMDPSCENVTCRFDQFSCDNNRKCVPNVWKCDGHADCDDNTDEIDCIIECDQKYDFQCNSKECISKDWRCDGQDDCDNGEDEINCEPVECREGEWKCKNGVCISERLKCDFEDDCQDNSDEDQHICDEYRKSCENDYFLCPSDATMCIPIQWRCDMQPDCKDGEDEMGCTNTTCLAGQFQCLTVNRCIPKSWLCDWQNDCEDGSDEDSILCDRTTEALPTTTKAWDSWCDEGMFICDNGQCVSGEAVCDGIEDCLDTSDEGGHCAKACISNGGCSEICHPHPFGRKCSCHTGFVLASDGKTCEDLDECQEFKVHGCSQICVNSKRSYKCECVQGYALEPNGKTCKATGELPKILFTHEDDIRFFEANIEHITSFKPSHSGLIAAFDYDMATGSIYWSDIVTAQIQYIDTEKGVIHPFLENIANVRSLAIDWVARNLYFISLAENDISVCSLTGGHCARLVTQHLHNPGGMAVNPLEGILFWSNRGANPRIERSWMDGSERHTIITGKMSWPNGLSLDLVLEKIYWTDSILNVIEVADFTGDNRKILVSGELEHPFSVSIFEDAIYWSEWGRKGIFKANKFTGQNETLVYKTFEKPMAMKVIHAVLQPNDPDSILSQKCQDQKCSSMCLLTKGGSRCHCPTGFTVDIKNPAHCVEIDSKAKHPAQYIPRNDTIELPEMHVCPSDLCDLGIQCLQLQDGSVYCSCPGGFSGAKCDNRTGLFITYPILAKNSYAWVAGVLCFLVILVAIVVGAIICCKRKRHSSGSEMISVIHFRNFLFGERNDESRQSTANLVTNTSYENPGFHDDEGIMC